MIGFEDNKTLNASGFGEVILGKVSWFTVYGLNMSNIGPGILILDSSHINIENITLQNIAGPGIIGHLSDNITIENVYISGSGREGIRIPVCDRISILNTTISGNTFINGIYSTSSTNVIIDKVDIGGVSYGLYLYGYTTTNITLINSKIHSFSQYGFYANSGTTSNKLKGIVVKGNEFVNTGYDAVYLATVEDGTVSQNYIWTTAWTANLNGVRLTAFTTNVIVERNIIEGLQTAIYLGSAYGNFIRNNTLFNQSYSGITMYSSSQNIIENNSINKTGTYGIIVGTSSNSNIFRWNYIGNSTSYGLYFQNGTNYNQIYQNFFYFNRGSNKTYNSSHVQAYDASGKNYWNSTNYGNYWYDWTTPDANNDGIVDNPYVIDGGAGAQDNYPLTEPTVVPEYSWSAGIILVLAALLLWRRK